MKKRAHEKHKKILPQMAVLGRVFSSFSLFPPPRREVDVSFEAQSQGIADIWRDTGQHLYNAIDSFEDENEGVVFDSDSDGGRRKQ